MKCLLIDDNAENNRLIEVYIKRHGSHQIVKVDNIPEALYLTITHDFNVIFLDIMMPEYDGKDYLKIIDTMIKKKRFTKTINVVIISAIDSQKELDELAKYPFVQTVVRKPAKPNDVNDVIDK